MNLDKFKNRQPFKVPDGYFEEFESNMPDILQRGSMKVIRSPKRKPLARIIRYTACAAAVILATIIVGARLTNSYEQTAQITSQEVYDNSDFIDEVLNNYPIDDYTFYCCLTDNDNNY